MNDQATISDQIAEVLGDARGSYEQLMSVHICLALGVDPAFRGQLIPSPTGSSNTAAFASERVASGDGAGHR